MYCYISFLLVSKFAQQLTLKRIPLSAAFESHMWAELEIVVLIGRTSIGVFGWNIYKRNVMENKICIVVVN